MNGFTQVAVLVLLTAASATGQQTRGFGEARLSLFPGASGQKWQLVERVRPTLESELHERVKLVATVELALTQGRDLSNELERTLRESDFGPFLDALGCRWPERTNALFRIDGADDYLDVDRLYVDAYLGEVDVRFGRQAINWGSAQFFNPTDPFPEVLFAEPWRPRRGVNAARLNVPFDETRDLTVVAALNDALNEGRAAGRLRVNFAETDVAMVAAWRGGDRGLIGVDVRGTLGVGWWVEAAYFLGGEPYEQVSAGIDYSFPVLERATAFAQYHRNGAGTVGGSSVRRMATSAAVAPECSGGSAPFGQAEPDPFAPFVTGRDYLMLGASLVILPELSTSVAALQNLNDGSGMAVPTVSYSALDWLDVALSAQLPYALDSDGGELAPGAENLRLELTMPPGRTVSADFSGLVPAATVTFWTRASF